jgi:hypothetical protein
LRSDRERLLDIHEAGKKVVSRAGRGKEAFEKEEDLQLALVHLMPTPSLPTWSAQTRGANSHFIVAGQRLDAEVEPTRSGELDT